MPTQACKALLAHLIALLVTSSDLLLHVGVAIELTLPHVRPHLLVIVGHACKTRERSACCRIFAKQQMTDAILIRRTQHDCSMATAINMQERVIA